MKKKMLSVLLSIALLLLCVPLGAMPSVRAETTEDGFEYTVSDGEVTSKTCSVCGLTDGYPLGHAWSTPTCTEASECYFCDLTRGEPLGHDYVNGVCTRCGDGATVTPEPEPPVESSAVLNIGSAIGEVGETVALTFKMQGNPAVKSMALSNFAFDTDKLEIVGGKWTVEDSVIANWDATKQNAAIAFAENAVMDGAVFTLTVRIKDGVEFTMLPITCDVVAKTVVNGEESVLALAVAAGEVQVGIPGNMDGNDVLDSNDAVYLLYHTLLHEQYPLFQSGDLDRNGVVNSNDAIYLLYHCLLPEEYPI